jgi:ribosome biogenesis GTPase
VKNRTRLNKKPELCTLIKTEVAIATNDMIKTLEGVVEKSTGSWYAVRMADGSLSSCRLAGKVRLAGSTLTNPIAVGDRVLVENSDGDHAIIQEVLPRTNYIARQSPHSRRQMHALAANIDRMVLFTTIVQPSLKPGFVDRFLLGAEAHGVPAVLVLNKIDLYDEAALDMLNVYQSDYERIGYQVFAVSAQNNTGIEPLRGLLCHGLSLLAGQSGVGKTSILNRLEPTLNLRTGQISDYSGKGQHTTTFAEMHHMSCGGRIIDTPGIKALTFNHLAPIEIAHNFKEFFALSENCRFGSTCMHRNEPDCAVKAALENEEVSPMRYYNYLQLLEESEQQNYWERPS